MNMGTLKMEKGRLVVNGLQLLEGQEAIIIQAEANTGFSLRPEEEEQLRASMAKADRGELVDGHTLLNSL